MNTFASIYGKRRFYGFKGFAASFFMSLLFLVSIYISCLIIVGGDILSGAISGNSTGKGLFYGASFLRFLLFFFFLYISIYLIYDVLTPAVDARIPQGAGALVASSTLVIVSVIFSRAASVSSHYTLVYGSISSVIILMVWFYICGIILIMGNVLNLVIFENDKR